MTSARRTQAERHAETHDALLAAAVTELATRGAHNVTQVELSARAGVTKGAYNHHFTSQQRLYEETFKRCAAVISERTRAAWESPGTPPERVRAAVRALWRLRREGAEEVVALAEITGFAARDDALRALASDHLQATLFDLAARLIEAMGAFGFRPKLSPDVVARVILGALDGMALHAVYVADASDDELARALETVVFGLFEA